MAKQEIKEIDAYIKWEKRRPDLAVEDRRIIAIRSDAERSSVPPLAETNLVVVYQC